MQFLIFLITIFLTSLVLTGLVRYYSLRKAILDVPNERSSHTLPTPRGGGIAVAVTFFLGVGVLYKLGWLSLNISAALIGGGLLIAIAGYWDDVKSLSAKKRALFHFLAAGVALYFLGGFPVLDLGFMKVHWGLFGTILAAVGIVWLINLYNFMDGIDGIAGSEAVFVSVIGGVVLALAGSYSLGIVCLVLALSVLGFLIWNFPPAKIFLGDVGSGLLGYIFAVLALSSANQNKVSIFVWLALLAVFVFDATYTLVYRLLRRQRWYEAHREHVYQRLTQLGHSHGKVMFWIVLVNLLFILPLVLFMIFLQKIAFLIFIFIGLMFLLLWYLVVKQNLFTT